MNDALWANYARRVLTDPADDALRVEAPGVRDDPAPGQIDRERQERNDASLKKRMRNGDHDAQYEYAMRYVKSLTGGR